VETKCHSLSHWRVVVFD